MLEVFELSWSWLNNFRVYFNRFRHNCCLKKRTVEANNIDHENLFHLIGWMHIASQTFYWRKSILRQSGLRYKHSHRKFFFNEEHFEPTLTIIRINWFWVLIDLPSVHVTLFYSYCNVCSLALWNFNSIVHISKEHIGSLFKVVFFFKYIHVLAPLCSVHCARSFKLFSLQGRQTSG